MNQYWTPFTRGYVAAQTGTISNPYILTSNNSDAYLLGVKAFQDGLLPGANLHKSRGNTWIMNGVKYKVEFKTITTI